MIESNKLVNLFDDLQDSAFERLPVGEAKVNKGYLICILPRSGSTYLTHLLRDNHFYGYPQEWFNYDSITSIIDEFKIRKIQEYLHYLWGNHSSENGVFGLELSYPQFSCLHEVIPLEGVLGQGFRWFYLVRANVVLQAISLYIAEQTGVYHSYMIDKKMKNCEVNVEYNAEKISSLITMLIDQEASFEKLFSIRGVSPIRLSYESIFADNIGTVGLFKNAIGVGGNIKHNESGAITKIGGAINLAFEERFRNTQQVFLEEAKSKRPVVTTLTRMV